MLNSVTSPPSFYFFCRCLIAPFLRSAATKDPKMTIGLSLGNDPNFIRVRPHVYALRYFMPKRERVARRGENDKGAPACSTPPRTLLRLIALAQLTSKCTAHCSRVKIVSLHPACAGRAIFPDGSAVSARRSRSGAGQVPEAEKIDAPTGERLRITMFNIGPYTPGPLPVRCPTHPSIQDVMSPPRSSLSIPRDLTQPARR